MTDGESFYRDEHPAGEGGGGHGGGGGGHGGGSWHGIGGGGSGHGGGGHIPIRHWWSGPGGDTPPPSGEITPVWNDTGAGAPVLKLSLSGYLLTSDARLLAGTKVCNPPPGLLLWIEPSDMEGMEGAEGVERMEGHAECVLLDAPENRLILRSGYTAPDGENPPVRAWDILRTPGTFRIAAKWQSGHFDYKKISRVKLQIFGISLGFLPLPLTAWRTVAEISISPRKITVNHIVV